MIGTFVILFASFILLATFLGRNRSRKSNFPSVPYSLPIFGNLFQLSVEPFKDYVRLREKYGDIFSVDLGSLKMVIVNDYKLIKEAYNHINLSGRPLMPQFAEPETGVAKGIIFSEGRYWQEQRRFALKTLRDFGFGKKSMESLVHEEIKELIESFKKDVNKPIYINEKFNIAVFNALWTIVAGERYSHSESKIKNLVQHLSANMEANKALGNFICFPWFSKIMPEYSGLNKFIENNKLIYNFMRDIIAEHKKTFQSGNNRDVVDCYLEQMEQTTDTQSSFHKDDGESHLVMTLYDLFLGGTETTSYTLVWMFYVLAANQDIQEKLHKEIKKVVGDARLPSLTDRPNLPYLEAVVIELMRFSSIFPGTFRRAVEDVELQGYFIPKGTSVYANFYCVNNDRKIWGDPENFRPERFLSDDGSKALKHEALTPFSYGRRLCPGESLARDQLFLFTASLFQRFKVSLGPGEATNKVEIIVGAMLMYPQAKRVVLQDRYNQLDL